MDILIKQAWDAYNKAASLPENARLLHVLSMEETLHLIADKTYLNPGSKELGRYIRSELFHADDVCDKAGYLRSLLERIQARLGVTI